MSHDSWARALELENRNCLACVPQLLKPTHLEPELHNKGSRCDEKPVLRNEELASALCN